MQIRFWYVLGVALAMGFTLSSCDRLGIADPAREVESLAAESSATGGGCRHAGRAIEDCYVRNPAARRAAVFSGWKEMDAYMRENKIEVIKTEAVLIPAQKAALDPQEAIVNQEAVAN